MTSEAARTATGVRWGVYCLGNDAVFEWLVALFESLREQAPEIPVLVIPYDDRQERLATELARRGHAYFESTEIDALHALGRRYYADDDFAARGFRKLAAFAGAHDRFFVLDADVIALAPLRELCAAIERSAADLVHFDTDPDQVYRRGPLRDSLSAIGGARGFNAGLFAARRGLLDAGRLAATLSDLGPDWREQLVPNAEQPFLNLFAERRQLALAFGHELVGDLCSTTWPAVGRLANDGSSWRLRGTSRWDEGWRFAFAHWAGFELSPAMPNYDLWLSFRSRGASRTSGD